MKHGNDRILGGRCDDYLVAAYAYFQVASDAPASPDFIGGVSDNVLCGPGIDVVYAGFEDFVAPGECEYVYRYEGF